MPASAIMPLMVLNDKAKINYKNQSVSLEKAYFVSDEALLDAAKELYSGCQICTSQENLEGASNLDELFVDLIKISQKEIIFVTPYVSKEFIDAVDYFLKDKKELVTIITNKPSSNLALNNHAQITKQISSQGYKVYYAKKDLHAKLFLFDKKAGIITSSNLTKNGFFNYFEVGTIVFEKQCKILNNLILGIVNK